MIARVLIVTTSRSTMKDGSVTGLWAEDLATPYYALCDSGYAVALASMGGGPIPFDPRSIHGGGPQPASVARLLADRTAMQQVQIAARADTLEAAGFDALYLPGGHGCLWDMPNSEALGRLVAAFDAAGKPVAALCHGPAGLLNARRGNGRPLVAGRRLCAFTVAEEERLGTARSVPFLLAEKLADAGAQLSAGAEFQPHAVRDGNLITGQNPASAGKLSTLLLQALAERAKAAA